MELLGVIIILAIISVIVIPNVIKIIDESKASAVETSAQNYLRAVEQEIINKNIKGNFNPSECVIQSDGNLICDGNIPLTIDAKGRKPSSGTIIIKNKVPVGVRDFVMNGYELDMTENGEVLVKGTSSSWNPGSNQGGNTSTITKNVTLERTAVGSNFIIVRANLSNNTTIEKIEYSSDNGSTYEEDGTNLIHTFNGLNKDTSYKIIARVTINGKEQTTEAITVNTKDITQPSYAIDTTDTARSKTVTINYPIIEGQTLTYEYSLDKGTTWKSATQQQDVTFKEPGTIIARATDGTNTVTASTFTVDNIEVETAVLKILDKVNDVTVTNYTDGNIHEMYTFNYEPTQQTGSIIGAETEYRYIGNDPYNYVKFNNELWRIIGISIVEDGEGNTEQRMKIIRNVSVGNQVWNTITTSNEWKNSAVHNYLNNDYYNTLRDEAKSMIGDAKYYLGGHNIYAQDGAGYYSFERGRTVASGNSINWIGKIGLMYPSDYLYTYANGVSAECYSNSDRCSTTNMSKGWIYSGADEWTILPSSYRSAQAFFLRYNSYIIISSDYKSTYAEVANTSNSYIIRPVVYLSSNVKIVDGTGEQKNPYTLALINN